MYPGTVFCVQQGACLVGFRIFRAGQDGTGYCLRTHAALSPGSPFDYSAGYPLNEDGLVVTELDSVPGGFGLTAELGKSVPAGYEVIGCRNCAGLAGH